MIINDRPHIALLSNADGVHLGQTDLSIRDVRRLAGASLLIGVSTHTPAQAAQAAADGADYCGVGPMFPTSTKDAGPLAGPAYLRAYLENPATARIPHLAIGGITPTNLPELLTSGCRGIAISRAVCSSPNPREVCQTLLTALCGADDRGPRHAGSDTRRH